MWVLVCWWAGRQGMMSLTRHLLEGLCNVTIIPRVLEKTQLIFSASLLSQQLTTETQHPTSSLLPLHTPNTEFLIPLHLPMIKLPLLYPKQSNSHTSYYPDLPFIPTYHIPFIPHTYPWYPHTILPFIPTVTLHTPYPWYPHTILSFISIPLHTPYPSYPHTILPFIHTYPSYLHTLHTHIPSIPTYPCTYVHTLIPFTPTYPYP